MDNRFVDGMIGCNMKNQRLIRALRCEAVDRPPIWLMRQAGRYLPEYRKIRQSAGSFMALMQNPELAAEVTLQPLKRFDLDAAIIFSDILTIPHAMGLELSFQTGEGPVFASPVQTMSQVKQLPNMGLNDKLQYVFDAIALTKQELDESCPLIGFAGSPWTLACYMIEGCGSKTFATTRALMYREPHTLYALCEKLTQGIIHYLLAQVEAGADVLMLFDSWGGLLTPNGYRLFSLEYMQQIIEAVHQQYPNIPIILFTKGGGLWVSQMIHSGAQAIGIDWTLNLAQARELIPETIAIQGNLDPAVLYGAPETIIQLARENLQVMANRPGFIFNLGHGLYPDIPVEHVQTLIEAVQSA